MDINAPCIINVSDYASNLEIYKFYYECLKRDKKLQTMRQTMRSDRNDKRAAAPAAIHTFANIINYH